MKINRANLLTWMLALVLTLVGGISGTAKAQATSVLPPDQDPFYTPPSGYQNQANGTVLRSRPIDAQYLLPILTTGIVNEIVGVVADFAPYIQLLQNLQISAYQVLYKSTDTDGNPVTGVTTIITPITAWTGKGARPLVSFETAEDSISNVCEPSYTLRVGLLEGLPTTGLDTVFTPASYEIVMGLLPLLSGYAVAIPDYEGPQSEWLAGVQAGHAVLDAATAALSYFQQSHANFGLTTQSPVGIWGYSGGGGAAGWAAALHHTYAPGLNVVGAAIGAASNADLTGVYNANDGQLIGGILPEAIEGLNRAYPSAGIQSYMNAAGQNLLATASNANLCTISQGITFAFAGKMENYTINPLVPLPQSKPGKAVLSAGSLVGQSYVPDMPVLNYNDEYDSFVPVSGDDAMAKQFCKAGVNVEIERMATPLPGTSPLLPVGWDVTGLVVHIVNEVEGAIPAYGYLVDRFGGATAPRNDCPRSAVWGAGLGLPYDAFITQ